LPWLGTSAQYSDPLVSSKCTMVMSDSNGFLAGNKYYVTDT